MTTTGRTPVEVEPIARVLPMLSVPHLDREFDYLVSAEQSDDAQPGVRVRVRFHGRLVDGFVLERRNDTDHAGKLGWLDRVVSAEPVLTPEIRRLVDAVAAEDAREARDLLEAQQFALREKRVVGTEHVARHAVDAAEVAAVGDRDAQVVQPAAERVFARARGRAQCPFGGQGLRPSPVRDGYDPFRHRHSRIMKCGS